MNESASQRLLDVQDLSVRFLTRGGEVHAVNGVSLFVAVGERVALVGESGCGKTATSLAVMDLHPKRSTRIAWGQILFDGADLSAMPHAERRHLRGSDMAMIFQDPLTSLNPVLTIGEQLAETLHAHQSITKAAARQRAIELLQMVAIPGAELRLRSYPHQLSGGMRQRIIIAIALALQPRLLIADEPTTALDVTIQAQVLDLLRRLTAERGTSLLLITHDLGIVAELAERVYVMYAGTIAESATTLELFDHPRHPYTLGLLQSLPRLDQPRGLRLIPIEGTPPSLSATPIGCPFAPRCSRRLDVCTTTTPPLVAAGADAQASGHWFACHNPVGANEPSA